MPGKTFKDFCGIFFSRDYETLMIQCVVGKIQKSGAYCDVSKLRSWGPYAMAKVPGVIIKDVKKCKLKVVSVKLCDFRPADLLISPCICLFVRPPVTHFTHKVLLRSSKMLRFNQGQTIRTSKICCIEYIT